MIGLCWNSVLVLEFRFDRVGAIDRDRRLRHVQTPNQRGEYMGWCAESRAFQWYPAGTDTIRIHRVIAV